MGGDVSGVATDSAERRRRGGVHGLLLKYAYVECADFYVEILLLKTERKPLSLFMLHSVVFFMGVFYVFHFGACFF